MTLISASHSCYVTFSSQWTVDSRMMGTREAYEVALVSLLDTGGSEALAAKMSQRQRLLAIVRVWW